MAQLQVNKQPYNFLIEAKDKRFIYMYGGAASSKSWTVAQFLIVEKLLKEKNIGILCLRRTKPSVKSSCLRLMHHLFMDMEIPHTENKTELFISAKNNNTIYFDSIDDIEKKKSLEGINYIWIEEATEFTEREILQLNLRCRAANSNGINQLYFSYNPVDPIGNAWLKNRTDEAEAKEDSTVLNLTHTDNPFLSNEEREQIEALADLDQEYNKIYRLGQWATPTHLIYNNWDIIDKIPDTYKDEVYGIDWGFNSPTAVIRIVVKDDEMYEEEILYEKKLTTPDILKKIKGYFGKTTELICDSAEPDRIVEFCREGINAKPAKKGQGSVAFGIDLVKSRKIHILSSSENLIREKRGYKWKEDKDGNVLDEPVPYDDHLMDAERYVATHIFEGGKIAFIKLPPLY